MSLTRKSPTPASNGLTALNRSVFDLGWISSEIQQGLGLLTSSGLRLGHVTPIFPFMYRTGQGRLFNSSLMHNLGFSARLLKDPVTLETLDYRRSTTNDERLAGNLMESIPSRVLRGAAREIKIHPVEFRALYSGIILNSSEIYPTFMSSTAHVIIRR